MDELGTHLPTDQRRHRAQEESHMPDTPIDPMIGPKYVLEGKVVTMGPQGVLPRGAI